MFGSLQRALVRPVALLRLTADRESYREYLRLREARETGGREVELRIGPLAGRPVWVREGTGDVDFEPWDDRAEVAEGEECAADLRKLGFEAGPDVRHDSAVLGTRSRPGSASVTGPG